MNQVPKDISAARRARWLADLSEALDHAEQVAAQLSPAHLRSAEGVELRARLTAARAQVKGLRLGRPDEQASELNPKWSNPLWPDGGPGRGR